MPDLTSLPVLSAAGELAPGDLPDQGFWLDVAAAGLYRLELDGPGVVGLTGFDTADGRSEGGDPQQRLMLAGSAYRSGMLEDLLLLPGYAYLVQIGAAEHRGLRLQLVAPINPAQALSGAALPGLDPEAPMQITPGQEYLLKVDGSASLAVTGPGLAPMVLEVIVPPGADADVSLEGMRVGKGGLFPLPPFDSARMEIANAARNNATLPVMMLRVRLLAEPARYDEVEPGDTDLGVLPPSGRAIRGALLAGNDSDAFEFVLDQSGVLDLSLQIDTKSRSHLTLRHEGVEMLSADVTSDLLFRPGLTLQPGSYRLEISGQQDTPLDYVLSLEPALQPSEGEPDDWPELARNLEPGQALRGTLGPENPGHIRFTVTEPGHSWELRAAQGLQDMVLTDGNDAKVGQWQAISGALVLRLALPPGIYTARLRGDGPYAMRLADMGPVPEGVETEPNDGDNNALRLRPGVAVTGDFQAPGDVDDYEIILGAPTPLTLTVTGPDDGATVVDLYLSDAGRLRAELPLGLGPVSYSALFPAGRQRIEWRARDDGISGRYAMRLERTNQPDRDEPNGEAAIPGDGVIAGLIGGFDAEDRVFVPLPIGSGAMALVCQGNLLDWEMLTYGDEKVLDRAHADEMAVVPYGPELGGAVELRLAADSGTLPARYRCRLRFAPAAKPLPPVIVHVEATDQDQPIRLTTGQRIEGRFEAENDRDYVALAVPVGDFAGLRCDVTAEQIHSDGAVRRALERPALPDGTRPFLSDSVAAVLELGPVAGAAYPQDWACDLIAEAGFATPAMMGPAAAFTGYHDPAAAPVPFDPQMALSLLSKGRPDWLSPTQVTADLNVVMQLSGLDQPFRAYSLLGQSAELILHVQNPGAENLDVDLDIDVLADGWRVAPKASSMSVAPGQESTQLLRLELPPMQSPVLDPQVMITAHSGSRLATVTTPVALDAKAAEREGHPFWSAPESLRGGLNPLLWQFGGRLIELDNKVLQESDADHWAFLHDGMALQSEIPAWIHANQLTFRLAEPAPIAGFVAHLRSSEDRGRWPALLGLELSTDGTSWVPALKVAPTASDLPQIFELPAPMQAGFARITLLGCRLDIKCDRVALAEVGLVAAPAWRLTEPVDLADPALGGHVVTGQALGGTYSDEAPFGGRWNDGLLIQRHDNTIAPAGEGHGDRIQAVIGFYAARAGRVAAVDWIGRPDDIERLDGVSVEISINGPGGPWQPAGLLRAPPPGEVSTRLDLPTPVWARALRLTFQRDAAKYRAIPDRIRVWEDPTAPPLWGLWEDDRPDAGFEATVAQASNFAPPPTGGPDRDHPVGLDAGQTVVSSVQMERNADWWQIELPQGPPRLLSMRFAKVTQSEIAARLTGPDGNDIGLKRKVSSQGDLILSAPVGPGRYLLAVEEPPRSVAILWDTSGSVQAFVPGILSAVRLWSQSLQPGRDRLQLLPFGRDEMLLHDWAETPEETYPALAALPATDSSDAESALGVAATALSAQDGQRGIVIITDAETAQAGLVWAPLLQANPRIVALSIDSSTRESVTIMKDWASLNGGYFSRVIGNAGLADGLDLAAALFRAPKGYALSVTADALREPEGKGLLVLHVAPDAADAPPGGGIEVILDASGSMLKRLADGQRRIAVAHEALARLVRDTLPARTPFAFRAFGLAVDACNSELLIPLGPLDPAAAEAAIRDVPAINLAKTAIAASLALAGQDLAAVTPPRMVVLVTDGEETCDGDVAAEIARLNEAGLDLRLTIVGFAIDDAALSADFAAWARASGGQYLSAGDDAALDASITQAIAPRFAVDRIYLDGRVEELAVVGLESPMTLPAGRFRLRPLQTARGSAVTIDIAGDTLFELTYDPALGLSAK